jgi:hypothetical protein
MTALQAFFDRANALSRYLEEKLPALEFFEVYFKGKDCVFTFHAELSPFLENVVLPELEREFSDKKIHRYPWGVNREYCWFTLTWKNVSAEVLGQMSLGFHGIGRSEATPSRQVLVGGKPFATEQLFVSISTNMVIPILGEFVTKGGGT